MKKLKILFTNWASLRKRKLLLPQRIDQLARRYTPTASTVQWSFDLPSISTIWVLIESTSVFGHLQSPHDPIFVQAGLCLTVKCFLKTYWATPSIFCLFSHTGEENHFKLTSVGLEVERPEWKA